MALILNYYGLLLGVVFNLPCTWKAFLRGKRTRNLYKSRKTDHELLEMTVGPLRKSLGLIDDGKQISITEIRAFVPFFLLIISGLIALGAALIVAPILFIYSLYIGFFYEWQITNHVRS